MKKYLLDSNAAIDYIGGKLPVKAVAWLDGIIEADVSVSVINRIEILGFKPSDPSDFIPFDELLKTVDIIGLHEEIILQAIEIRRGHKIKLPDAIVAATALTLQLTVITRNIADFQKILDLEIVNPHDVI